MFCLILAVVALGMRNPTTAALFGVSGLCFLFASAGVRVRGLTVGGAAVFVAVLAWIAWAEGAPLDLVLVLGIPPVCVAAMSYVLRGVQTKQRTGSTPSSARSS